MINSTDNFFIFLLREEKKNQHQRDNKFSTSERQKKNKTESTKVISQFVTNL